MSDRLAEILARKREEVARGKSRCPEPALLREAETAPPVRGFQDRLLERHRAGELALIAELKRASPSAGAIRADFDPARLARAYVRGGASCLSVLTDGPFFQGSADHLRTARTASGLPVLRKDFLIDPWQVLEARAMGADCVLVILAAVDDRLAEELVAAARELRMDVLLEVHDAPELERALRLSGMIGINNRDLRSLKVSLATFEELAPRVPRDRFLVAESGLATHRDLLRMRRAGAQAFLVGESLMRQPDVERATRRLLGRETVS